jgi:lipopolysaccharide assembly outer membrane protein LptD (OstA)
LKGLPLALGLACSLLSLANAGEGSDADPQAPPHTGSTPPPPGARRPRKETLDKPAESEPGEIRIKAETQGGDPSHYQFRGFVDLVAGDLRIQSELLDLYTTERPDGTKSRRIVAEKNVVFLRGDERLAGDRLDMDLDTGQGTFENAVGYVEPGVFVEGRKIERLDADTYRVEGGKFTSCAQPNPRWAFSASSAKIDVDDKIIAKNVVFKLKSVPAFYTPFVVYPIRDDQRSTGFLLPHVGFSNVRGTNLGEGFFWAMGRSLDQTFYGDYYSQFGFGLGHELRYALDSPSRGVFRTYVFDPQSGGKLDYDLDYNALQLLPGQVRASVQVRKYSDLLFQQQFQDSLNRATTRSERTYGSLQRSFGGTTVMAYVDNSKVFFGDTIRSNERLPALSVRRSPKKIGKTGIVFGYEARAERLGIGNTSADVGEVQSYARYDIAPELSRPLNVSFLQLNPRVSYRYTHYTATDDGTGVFDGPALDRPYFMTAVEMRGPTFSRVFSRPGGFYSDRIKHVIGPEVTWSYRSKVDDFLAIPKFDGTDYLLGTHQVDYALVQRFLAKRAGPSGKLVPYEFLTWRIQQSYYVQIANNQNTFDPNYSSNVFGPGGKPDHNSPILSRLRFRPTTATSADFNVEYDVNFKQVRTLGLTGRIGNDRASVSGTWSRGYKLSEQAALRDKLRDTIRAAGRLEVLKDRFSVEGSADYDFILHEFLQNRVLARYDVQCCGFMIEAIQFNYNSRIEKQFRFAITLANVGSIGNFLGADPYGTNRAGGGLFH